MEKDFLDRANADVADFSQRINRYMAERTKLDINKAHRQVKSKYPVVLTNTFALENGEEDYGEDFQVLCGESSVGKFFLYDNGLYIVFDVDKNDGTYTHWHPSDTEEAIKDVLLFMDGKCKE